MKTSKFIFALFLSCLLLVACKGVTNIKEAELKTGDYYIQTDSVLINEVKMPTFSKLKIKEGKKADFFFPNIAISLAVINQDYTIQDNILSVNAPNINLKWEIDGDTLTYIGDESEIYFLTKGLVYKYEAKLETDDSPRVRAIKVDGKLYYDTGKISQIGRCGVMDGKVTSTVKSDLLPKKDNQSNFGEDYEYQKISDDRIDVRIDDYFFIFLDEQDKKILKFDDLLNFENIKIKEVVLKISMTDEKPSQILVEGEKLNVLRSIIDKIYLIPVENEDKKGWENLISIKYDDKQGTEKNITASFMQDYVIIDGNQYRVLDYYPRIFMEIFN